MREIIFRGKRVDNGEWVYGAYSAYDSRHNYYNGQVECEVAFMPSIIAYDDECFWYHVDPATVGQFTGKTVKNGKVFDGDVLKNIDGFSLVSWDEEKSAFVMRLYEYPYETLYLEEMWDDSEIIGNIHDNPELLEGGVNDG